MSIKTLFTYLYFLYIITILINTCITMPIKTATNILSFINEARKNPRSVGSITPSSKYLAEAISEKIPQKHNIQVIELGAGTGVISRAILDSGKVKHHNLSLVEYSPQLAKILQSHFRDSNILNIDASNLTNHIEPSSVDVVVCSLPLKIMDKIVVGDILNQAHKVLANHGTLIRFSYDLFSDLPIVTKKFTEREKSKIFLNVPPAIIRVYSKKIM